MGILPVFAKWVKIGRKALYQNALQIRRPNSAGPACQLRAFAEILETGILPAGRTLWFLRDTSVDSPAAAAP